MKTFFNFNAAIYAIQGGVSRCLAWQAGAITSFRQESLPAWL